MNQNPETIIVEFVPNPAAAGRLLTDTELLNRSMDTLKRVAEENHRLRQAITAVLAAPEDAFDEALAAAFEVAESPVPYSLTDFLPALRSASKTQGQCA